MSVSFTRSELLMLDLLLASSEEFITCARHPDEYARCCDKINGALHVLVDAQADATGAGLERPAAKE
jgi:hypothetical protein